MLDFVEVINQAYHAISGSQTNLIHEPKQLFQGTKRVV